MGELHVEVDCARQFARRRQRAETANRSRALQDPNSSYKRALRAWDEVFGDPIDDEADLLVSPLELCEPQSSARIHPRSSRGESSISNLQTELLSPLEPSAASNAPIRDALDAL